MPTTHSNRWIYHMDWSIIFIYVVLVVFGWMNIYSTTGGDTQEKVLNFSKEYGVQLIWIAIAFTLAFFVLLINSRFYSVFSYFIYFAVILLLISVLFLGKEVNGSRSWFVIGSMRLQPAEMAKLATALALAKLMSTREFKLKGLYNWVQVLAIIMLPVGLILLQKDWGSAAVFFILILMLYREGLSGWVLAAAFFTIALFVASLVMQSFTVLVCLIGISMLLFAVINRKFILGIIVAAAATALYFCLYYLQKLIGITHFDNYIILIAVMGTMGVAGIAYALRKKIRSIYFILLFLITSFAITFSVDYIFDNVLKQHHRDRIEDMLGTKVDIKGVGYNVHQAKVAIGSGGFTGKGYLQGTQTKLNFVPEQSTDFIFCTIGEEWGFIGSFVLIALYLTLLIRVILVSERQKHAFGRIYGYCVASIIFFHFAINIAMTIGLAPVIGIPLPFISYGGSSLLSFTLLLSILLKIDAVRYGER